MLTHSINSIYGVAICEGNHFVFYVHFLGEPVCLFDANESFRSTQEHVEQKSKRGLLQPIDPVHLVVWRV